MPEPIQLPSEVYTWGISPASRALWEQVVPDPLTTMEGVDPEPVPTNHQQRIDNLNTKVDHEISRLRDEMRCLAQKYKDLKTEIVKKELDWRDKLRYNKGI